MLPRDALGVNPLLRPSPALAVEALGDPRQQMFQRALAGELGKSMQGQVLARLADGSFVVRVNDMPARMMLPAGTELGSEVPLKLVAINPRPTFEMASGNGAATLVEALPAPPGTQLPAGAAAQPQDTEAATFIPHTDTAAFTYRPDGTTRQPTMPPDARPPAADAHAGAAAAAGAQVASSRALAQPELALAANRPKLPPAMPADEATLSATGKVLGNVMAAVLRMDHPATAVTARTPVLPAPSQNAAAIAPALRQALGKSGLFYESHVAEWAQGQRPLAELAAEPQMQIRPANPAEPEAAQLINLQLGAHEQGQVAWQGQLWPGQPMQWEISRDAPHGEPGQAGGDEPGPPWQSRLQLRLPALGDVRATIVLSGDRVAMRLEPGQHDAAALLQAHAQQLVDALAAAGTPLTALAIGPGPAANE
ncbi:MAG: flagellar hook-length control protein FliK [Telluria sp.]